VSARRALVTGAASGLGYEVAAALAAQGYDVVLADRNAGGGEAAARQIAAATPAARAEFRPLDLASLDEVRRFASHWDGPLHLLVNNAGILPPLQRARTADGRELAFGIALLGHFALTGLLLPALRRGGGARVVGVTSLVYRRARIDFDDLQCKRSYGMLRAYGQSKLAMLHFGYELAERLRGSGVTVNALHPGTVATNIGIPGWLSPFIATPEKGARTSIHLACAPELEQVTGRYFANGKEARSSRRSHDRAVGRRLWAVTEKLCGIAGPAA